MLRQSTLQAHLAGQQRPVGAIGRLDGQRRHPRAVWHRGDANLLQDARDGIARRLKAELLPVAAGALELAPVDRCGHVLSFFHSWVLGVAIAVAASNMTSLATCVELDGLASPYSAAAC